MIGYFTGTYRGYSENLPYVRGNTYALRINQFFFGYGFKVEAIHGYENKVIEGTAALYFNLTDLTKEWELEAVDIAQD